VVVALELEELLEQLDREAVELEDLQQCLAHQLLVIMEQTTPEAVEVE
tara:strand:+ start:487 stop:630 length:144 start_codon:yes stop_codon:yes gene_type:complete